MKNITQSKYNYYRGFKACLILIVLPIVLLAVVGANIFINNNL